MKYSTVALALLSLSGAIAQPHKQQQHHHQKHHEKRDVVWTTSWEIVTETLSITTTIWVDGDLTSLSPSTSTSQVPTTSTSTTQSPAEFHESPTPSPAAPTTSASVAPYIPPTPSTSSIYVPPAAPTSTYVAPADPATTSVYVAPTTSQAPYVAPDSTTAAPAAATTPATSSSNSGGTCSSGSPCTGDITYYQASLGACGITNDGDTELVIALPHELMGTQSNGNPYCGKTVTIEKDGVSITATVVDKCMGCDGYSIDLSNFAFSSLGVAFSVGRTQATWYFND
jgi:hypothetical protein